MSGDSNRPSVWTRSRELASREIHETAIRLFLTQGYEQTTTEQIAREVGVSQRTLFRYFGTKEDLVCGEQDALGVLLRETVERQPAGVSAWQALRTGFMALTTARHTADEALVISTLIFRTPALRARYEEKRIAWQYALLPVVRARVERPGQSADVTGHIARTVIAVSFACADAATGTWIAGEGRDDMSALYDEALRIAGQADLSA
ncbi:TetR/AcrR family transcriptional regulator [Streptomyces sp. P6-2-1]|uniref:TetR/AcrR family transcriptional regulator n=1 Tax=unclassified Streptomyces TaxID=2593676 RepID=UPI003D3613FB